MSTMHPACFALAYTKAWPFRCVRSLNCESGNKLLLVFVHVVIFGPAIHFTSRLIALIAVNKSINLPLLLPQQGRPGGKLLRCTLCTGASRTSGDSWCGWLQRVAVACFGGSLGHLLSLCLLTLELLLFRFGDAWLASESSAA